MRAVEPGVAVELGPNPSTPGTARALVREHWTLQAQPELLEVVGLCVSELVTNALDHVQPPYQLRLSIRGTALRIEIDDATVEAPIVRSQHPLQARGRGMFLVETLSRAWGVLPSAHGKTVWAEF